MRPSRSPSGSTPTQTTSPGGDQARRDRPDRSRRAARAGFRVSRIEAGSGAPCELLDDVEQRVGALPRARRRRATSARKRPSAAGSTGSTSWRSLASERRRSVRSTSASRPLAPRAGRAELALDEPPVAASRSATASAAARPRPKRAATSRRRTARACARSARQIAERIAHRLEQRRGNAGRQRNAERVAIARGVLDGDQYAASPAIADGERRGARATSSSTPAADARRRRLRAQLVGREIADASSRSWTPSAPWRGTAGRAAAARARRRRSPRRRAARAARRRRAARAAALDRWRAPARALGERRVAFVEEAGDVGEQQRGGERRRRARVSTVATRIFRLRDVARACRRAPAGRRRRAGTRGRSRAATGNDPYRDATASRSAARLRCGHSGVRLPGRRRGSSSARAAFSRNLRGEERRRAELPDDQLLDLVRVGQEQLDVRRLVRHPESARRCRRRSTASRRRAALLAELRRDGHRPRRVHAPAERREDAHAPVAELVARSARRRWSRRRAPRPSPRIWSRRYCSRFSAARASSSCSRVSRSIAAAGGSSQQVARQLADRAAELERAAGAIAVPERHLPGLARRRRHEDAVVRDLLDAPATRRRAGTSRPACSRRPSPRRARRRAPRPARAPTRNTP